MLEIALRLEPYALCLTAVGAAFQPRFLKGEI
jgi:hypothetical protein